MDKIVLITGGGSGIGLQFARLVHGQGARVLLADLKLSPPAEEFVNAGQLQSPGRIVFQPCDVRKWDDLQALIRRSQDTWSEVPDIYIPAAGVFEPSWSSFWDDTEDSGYASVEININHPIKLTRLAVRALLGANKPGAVCITASQAGLAGTYTCPLYCATKHAIVGFVRSMAHCEALEGVKVTTVCPTSVRTPMLIDDSLKKEQYSVERGFMLTPEEVADAMFALVTEESYAGGTVMELAAGGRRVVPEWQVAPPPEEYGPVSDEAKERALAPVLRITKEERGGA
ncbi:hypothetical protein FE257_009119 [Aspergillus nanangensis]|uniref:Uncharacterized protein n=1 Tax=Aspergillus nanangensis TaxID=2582783 RepID=A0AAD4GYP6_ASPNN|nr:hypothetical protein FE257_009119 [Aspergillus nanangensis]